MINKIGIKQQILAVTSENEAIRLLNEVKGYKFAHPSTVRKCDKAAKVRISQLNRATS